MMKGIIFDYNGVITSGDWYWLLIRKKVANFTQEKSWFEDLANRVDLGQINPDQLKDQLAIRLGIDREELEMFKENIELSSEYMRQELIAYIKEIKGVYKIALLSNYNAKALRPLIKKHNLKNLFDVIAISSETGFKKPDKEAFQDVLKKMDLDEKEVLFVDDQEKHVSSAQNMGIASMVYTTLEELKNALLF